MTGPRVAMCSASVGHGHSRAAAAVIDALRARGAGRVDVLDALETAPRWFVAGYRDGYLATIRRAPAVAEWLYNAGDRAPRGARAGTGLERRALRAMASRPEVAGADVIVCTHFLCARVLSDLKGEGVVRAPMAVVVTDQHPHGIWLVPNAERVLVASEEARGAAVAAGLRPERVVVTGIPIDGRFREPLGKAEARARMGLPQDRPVALVSGGGLGLVEMEGVVHGLMESGRGVHAAVVCGHNGALRARLAPLEGPARAGAPSCTVLGYTTEMHVLMRAADVLVGKPGGLTTAEAAASGLAMVLTRPIPGQEERNARRLVGLGAAVLERRPRDAGRLAAELLMDGERLRGLGARAAALGRADAAELAAGAVLGLARAWAGDVRVETRVGVGRVGAPAV